MIRTCDGHRGHGESGCGFSTSTWPGGECPMCGGAMVDAPPEVVAKWYPAERRPVAGWRLDTSSLGPVRWVLRSKGRVIAAAMWKGGDRWGWWSRDDRDRSDDGLPLVDAQLAAEDALRAVEAEIAAVLR